MAPAFVLDRTWIQSKELRYWIVQLQLKVDAGPSRLAEDSGIEGHRKQASMVVAIENQYMTLISWAVSCADMKLRECQIQEPHEDSGAVHAGRDRTEENVNANTVNLDLQNKKNLELAHQALLEIDVGTCKSLRTTPSCWVHVTGSWAEPADLREASE